MHQILVLSTLILGQGEPVKVEKDVGDLSATYSVSGKEAGGKAYSGVCVIARRGDGYLVTWVVGGGSTFTGIGLRVGESFSAGWALQSEKGVVRGVNLYRVETFKGQPRLVGRWQVLPGNGQTSSETLTFLKAPEKEDD